MKKKKLQTIDQDKEIADVLIAERDSSSKLTSQEEFSILVTPATTNQVVQSIRNPSEELKKEVKKFIIPKLRSASYRWKPRSEAIKAARRERGIYTCASCKRDMKNGEFTLDHIDPVISISQGFTTWDDYIYGMFCEMQGFQLLCTECDDMKTKAEEQLRKYYRQKKKESKEKS